MPILAKEIDILPEDLFSLSPAGLPWAVAHVQSRQEKVLARQLVDHAVPFYLPLRRIARKSGGRTRTSHLPLFSGYVFFRGTDRGRDVVRRSGVTASIIDVPDQEQLHSELAQLRALQLAGATFEPFDDLAAGDAVRITDGAFAGYSGTVVREKGKDRLIVRISFIRQAIAVEFPRVLLERSR